MELEKPVLLSEENFEEAILAEVFQGGFAYCSVASPVGNGCNQDALLVVPCGEAGAVFAVADGVGGGRSGHVASKTALASIQDCLEKALKEKLSIRTGIINGIEKANKEVLALGVGAATTLALVEVAENSCRSYHVGDSFVCVIGNKGKQKYLTIDHGPVGYGVEAGLIEETDAIDHEERNIVSNVLGSQEMRIEIGPTIELSSLDTVILGSDGVSDNLNNDEIISFIRAGELKDCAASLLKEVRLRMNQESKSTHSKPDDLTFVIFRPRRVND